ncbi:hypothetical protein F2P81_003896 [Scophthalmus maximus]|uniref:Integrase catalytic domain-containing protein n=1 Tax=Scophthalmus maximus TaxID=52904 RepID=A0A6A4TJU1_SCOMX|nr:hypothetical protein F2P81_003896 [Scophthalmus maximus]
MIRALPPKAKHRWPQVLKSLTFAYNCTIHETTGYAPFLLMFGRIPRLPIDMAFSAVLDHPEVVNYDQGTDIDGKKFDVLMFHSSDRMSPVARGTVFKETMKSAGTCDTSLPPSTFGIFVDLISFTGKMDYAKW